MQNLYTLNRSLLNDSLTDYFPISSANTMFTLLIPANIPNLLSFCGQGRNIVAYSFVFVILLGLILKYAVFTRFISDPHAVCRAAICDNRLHMFHGRT